MCILFFAFYYGYVQMYPGRKNRDLSPLVPVPASTVAGGHIFVFIFYTASPLFILKSISVYHFILKILVYI